MVRVRVRVEVRSNEQRGEMESARGDARARCGNFALTPGMASGPKWPWPGVRSKKVFV